jgi:hypothetical protein
MRSIFIASSLFAFGMISLLSTTSFAGNPGSKSIATAAKGKKSVANAAHIDKELAAIRNLLNKADHDYKGHRAAAVHQITHAIHLLQHGMHHPNPHQHFTGGTHKLPQAQSDAMLRQAETMLATVAKQLNGTNIAHHQQAHAAVVRAIHDLQLALKVA